LSGYESFEARQNITALLLKREKRNTQRTPKGNFKLRMLQTQFDLACSLSLYAFVLAGNVLQCVKESIYTIAQNIKVHIGDTLT
jgi:hypothetical protein